MRAVVNGTDHLSPAIWPTLAMIVGALLATCSAFVAFLVIPHAVADDKTVMELGLGKAIYLFSWFALSCAPFIAFAVSAISVGFDRMCLVRGLVMGSWWLLGFGAASFLVTMVSLGGL